MLAARDEALLPCKAFDRLNFRTVVHSGQRQARDDLPTVNEDRAGTAGSLVAALLGPGEVETFTQHVEERLAWGSRASCWISPFTVKRTIDVAAVSCVWAACACAPTLEIVVIEAVPPASCNNSRRDKALGEAGGLSLPKSHRHKNKIWIVFKH